MSKTPDREQETPARADLRQQLTDTLHKQGAYCGDCTFEDESDTCPDCIKVRGWYVNAILPVVEAHTAAEVRRALEEAADAIAGRKKLTESWGFLPTTAEECAHLLRRMAAAVMSPAREQGTACGPLPTAGARYVARRNRYAAVTVTRVWDVGAEIAVAFTWDEDGATSIIDLARFQANYQPRACCHLHKPVGCCDPEDCGPCCEACPTCPTLARQRAEAGEVR